MKEVIAIIRPKKVIPTKEALEKLGIPSLTAISVFGRGKQKGIATEIEIERPEILDQSIKAGRRMEYIPKRLFSIIARNEDVDTIVETIIKVNQTGEIGDGRIFVCPVDDAIRVRTDDRGDSALL